MALRPDRYVVADDISFFMDTTGEAGGIVTVSTGGSGVALDDASAVVAYHALGSGSTVYPVGMLMNTVVNKDLTKTHLNYYQDEVQIGNKVTLVTDGWGVTNMILGTPAAGGPAYLGNSGYVTPSQPNALQPKIGRFLSTKDADGYAKLYVKLPIV